MQDQNSRQYDYSSTADSPYDFGMQQSSNKGNNSENSGQPKGH